MGLGVMWLYATDKIMSVASNYIYIELPTVALDGWARISAAKVCSCPAVCAWPSHTDLCVPHVIRMCPQGAIAVIEIETEIGEGGRLEVGWLIRLGRQAQQQTVPLERM